MSYSAPRSKLATLPRKSTRPDYLQKPPTDLAPPAPQESQIPIALHPISPLATGPKAAPRRTVPSVVDDAIRSEVVGLVAKTRAEEQALVEAGGPIKVTIDVELEPKEAKETKEQVEGEKGEGDKEDKEKEKEKSMGGTALLHLAVTRPTRPTRPSRPTHRRSDSGIDIEGEIQPIIANGHLPLGLAQSPPRQGVFRRVLGWFRRVLSRQGASASSAVEAEEEKKEEAEPAAKKKKSESGSDADDEDEEHKEKKE